MSAVWPEANDSYWRILAVRQCPGVASTADGPAGKIIAQEEGMHRRVLGLLLTLALSGCSRPEATGAPANFAGPKDGFQDVCRDPRSPLGVGEAVRSLQWPFLRGSDVPRWLIGNGAVRWTSVVESPDDALLIAVGRLNETSFCRVYGRASGDRLEPEMETMVILEKPLGPPNVRQLESDGHKVSWLKSDGRDWRAIHLVQQQPEAQDPTFYSIRLEMTRPAPAWWTWGGVRLRLSEKGLRL